MRRKEGRKEVDREVEVGREGRNLADIRKIDRLPPVADTAYGREFGERLWKETVDVCVKVDERCGYIRSSMLVD